MDEDEIRRLIDQEIREALLRAGMDVDDPRAQQEDLAHCRRKRLAEEEAARWFRRIVLTVTFGSAGGGIFWLIWQALKHGWDQ